LPTAYDERMREKFVKPQPLSVVEHLDSRLLLRVLTDFRKGDFTARLPVDSTGVAGKVYDTINEIIDLNARLTKELERISTVVGKEGKIRHRTSLPGATGGWADCVDSVNGLVGDLIQPITDVSRVIGAVAKGDLSQRMEQEVEVALAKLPDEFREALLLVDVKELSYQEISGVLSIPIGTVKSRVSRGRALLRESLMGYAKVRGIIRS